MVKIIETNYDENILNLVYKYYDLLKKINIK